MYYDRAIKTQIKVLQAGFPIISITGPRQSGKTTLLQHNFPNYKYFNLEDPITLQTIKDDTKSFLINNTKKVIIDEIQRFPELLSYLQPHVDKTQRNGEIFITGSQNLLISEKISQSLAGRAAYLTIFPLSIDEMKHNDILIKDVSKLILKGGYPGLYTNKIEAETYFRQYIATYIERDVHQIRNISDLSRFQKFLSLLAGRVGQILNVSSLASDVGITPNTAEDWISILEASYIVYRLQPYFKNIGKRLIKSPKLYFHDTGLLTTLLRIHGGDELKQYYSYGSVFENFIINEFFKYINNYHKTGNIYFYRDSHGNEIDLIIDLGLVQIPVEIKSSSSYNSEFQKGHDYWRRNINSNSCGYCIYSGNNILEINGIKIIPWNMLELILKEVK